jgi:C4-dicarboxylate-specific signal transduction histidine kinase
MLVTVTASLVALFAVAGGLYLFQLRNFRETYRRELQTLAQIMADNCATALAFNDPKTAAEVLAPLRVKREIENAAVLGKSGEMFAHFGGQGEFSPPPDAPAGITDRGATWTVVQPIVLDGERIGSFFMDVHFARPRGELQRLYLSVTAAVLCGSLGLVVLLTLRLQNFIVRPVHTLALASQAVARDRDYSLRVPAGGADELGELTAAFNDMLARIQEQDAALHEVRAQMQDKMLALEEEIIERQRTAEALRVSQQRLIETSRLAGMAEVATGVLHNVGNVLNSVNVSAGIVTEKLRRSKVPHLAKAAALMAAQNGSLARFITEDATGRNLPGFLARLGENLLAENEALRREVEHLAQNIEHIKTVVAMQQSYAKVSGAFEILSPQEVVENALAMNRDAFARRGLVLERCFAPTAHVRMDRHKVLQILINLLRNAEQALKDVERADKRITISIEPAEDRVRIVVADNGVGIPPENLHRIFGHGFTTRTDGHGFGLHSGALAAREMGGALSVESGGPGCGATFTLELPGAPQPGEA